MLYDFDTIKHNIELLSYFSGRNTVILQKNNISCANTKCSAVLRLESSFEKTGYVFVCPCGCICFCVFLNENDVCVLSTPCDISSSTENGFKQIIDDYKLYSIIKQLSGSECNLLIKFEETALTYIKNNNYDELSDLISDFFDNNIVSSESITAMKSKTYEMVLSLFSISLIASVSEKPMKIAPVLLSNIKKAQSIAELKETINLLKKSLITRDSMALQDELVKNALAYIKNNIEENLTLDEVSAHIFVSSPYLSRIFKKVMGENFSDCINRLKIEKAVKLLTTTDMTINAIAEFLHFANSSYFSKVFKKYNSLTPAKYKMEAERIRKKNVDL